LRRIARVNMVSARDAPQAIPGITVSSVPGKR
jgi:hypothetical protein